MLFRGFIAWSVLAVVAAVPSDPAAKKVRHHPILFSVRTDPDRKGDVLCALYRDEDNWLEDNPYRNAQTKAGRKYATCRFRRVPKGVYAIAALHDEDGDGEMDTNFLGLPEEGYAASRDAHFKGFGAPDWEDAIFKHRSTRTTKQRARMKY